MLDEDVTHRLAGLLRAHGLNADSAKELGRLGLSDVQVLLRAAEHGQTVITHNNKDFRALHEAWVTWRKRWETEVEQQSGVRIDLSSHAGIVIVPAIPIGDLADIVKAFADSAPPMADRLYSWSRFRGWHELVLGQAR